MLKFILVASIVILFLIFSIPILIVEKYVGKKNPEKKNRQSLAIVRFMFRLILKVAGIHITVKGIENIPEEGPALYVGNHRSYFDILVGYTTVPSSLGFMAKKEMEKIPLLSNWMRNVNCLFLDRENVREGLKTILDGVDKVKNGTSVWIFPEGTRNDAGNYLDLMPFKEGSLKIAEKTGCPVVPVAITGTAESFEDHYPKIRSSQVTIEFGEPFIIPARAPRKTDAGANAAQSQTNAAQAQTNAVQAQANRAQAQEVLLSQAGQGASKQGKGGAAQAQAPAKRTIRTLSAEEKKFAGAYTRDLILDMLLKEKRLREGK